MHWFWRATIATAVGSVTGTFCLIVPLHDGFLERFQGVLKPFLGEIVSMPLAYYAPPIILSIWVYHILGPITVDHPWSKIETRCRKCGYILRGISEPRCPECGERI
ncbi:MAG: hypothetical protein AMXMBFR13_14800 [Phycisphaerae bacterium]